MSSDFGIRIADCQRPTSRDLTDRRSPRAAFTLFEILLVLVLLVVAGSLAAPLLHGSFASVRLRHGTDQVLAAWTSARNKAIETGQVFQFRFIPETGQYRVEPWVEAWNESPDAGNAAAAENELLIPVEDFLPEGIELVDAEQRIGELQGDFQAESLRDGDSGEWSAPIRFFPDGTTSPATVLLRNQRKQHQRATLRALTGMARASEVLSEEKIRGSR